MPPLARRSVRVETHGDVADEKPAGFGHRETGLAALDQRVGGELLEADKAAGEMRREIDAEHFLDGRELQPEVAHQAHDDMAPQHVFIAQLEPAFDRQAPGREALVIFLQRLVILTVSARRLGNGGNPEAADLNPAARAVTLEIALQRPRLQRFDQFVFRPRKVVHADESIARLRSASR